MKEPSDIFGPQIALQLCQNSVWALGAVSGKIDRTASMHNVENCAVQALIDAPRIMSQEADAPTVQRRTQGGAGPKAVFGILQKRVIGILKRKGGGKLPDLSGDGKITRKDVLIGRGVIKKKSGGQIGRPRGVGAALRGYGKGYK